MRVVTIAVESGVPEAVAAVVAEHGEQRARLSADDRWQSRRLPRAQAAVVRGQWRAEMARLRAEGRLLDTRDALAAFGVRAELAARGWDRSWPPVPDEAIEPGRWPGSRDGHYPARLTVRLDDALAEQVHAACWHTSCDAITALRTWRDIHPGLVTPRTTPPPTSAAGAGRKTSGRDGQEQQDEHAGHVDLGRQEARDGPLEDYERLAARVTTTGTIWRAALHRALTAPTAQPS